MLDLKKLIGFEWDGGNTDKSYKKHGITPREAEEAFLDKDLQIERDIKHVQNEQRFINIAKTFREKILFVVFTIRQNKIRIISARKANKQERRLYEKQKAKKNPTL